MKLNTQNTICGGIVALVYGHISAESIDIIYTKLSKDNFEPLMNIYNDIANSQTIEDTVTKIAAYVGSNAYEIAVATIGSLMTMDSLAAVKTGKSHPFLRHFVRFGCNVTFNKKLREKYDTRIEELDKMVETELNQTYAVNE